jgi:hypothetical protein
MKRSTLSAFGGTLTSTLKLQLAWPIVSVTVQTSVVDPTGKVDPEGYVQATRAGGLDVVVVGLL